MGRKYKFPLLLTTFVLLLLYCETAMAEMRIFELKYHSAAELSEPLRSMLSDQAKVSAYGNSLAVKAAESELDDVAQLIETLDQPQRMLRVSVDQGRVENSTSRELSGSGHVESGSTTIDFGRRNKEHQDGGSIFFSSGNSEMNVSGQDAVRYENRTIDQFVSVMEGQEARISVGRSVPYTSSLRSYCRHHATCVESIEYKNVDTGFIILPVVYGGLVQLEISPFMAFLEPKNPRQIVFQELSTKVRIPLGQWYDLGGQAGVQDDVSREILGSSRQSSRINSTFRLKVELQ